MTVELCVCREISLESYARHTRCVVLYSVSRLHLKYASSGQWWDNFKKARSGDSHFQVVCERYARMLEGARLQQRADGVYEEELVRYTLAAIPLLGALTARRPGMSVCGHAQ